MAGQLEASWTWRRTGGQDGDHARSAGWRSRRVEERPYHITHSWLHVMLIMCASCLIASIRCSTVAQIRWSLTLIPTSCSPLSVHHQESSPLLSRPWRSGARNIGVRIQWVEAMYPQQKTLKVELASLACTDMASEHKDRKIKHESHDWCDWLGGLPLKLYQWLLRSGEVWWIRTV